MAVLGRVLLSSGERLDLPDFLSLDSYAGGDWKFFLRGIVGDEKPFILKGFDVITPAVGSTSISIRIADSIVCYPHSSAGPFYHGLSEGNTLALPLVPDLRQNATNYVYLLLDTFSTARDARAFWDSDLSGGVGGEFTQDVDTETALMATVNVSTSAFPDNTIPICKVITTGASIQSIEDCRDLMFRLGTGGLSPDPYARFNFRSFPSAPYKRLEPPTIMTSSLSPNAFQGADKNVRSLKEWMDVVMTKLLELGGTAYWYEDVSMYSLINLYKDALGSTFKSKGQWSHSSSTPGLITWTEDLQIKMISDDRNVTIRSGNKTLNNEEVMFLALIRDESINTGNSSVNWYNAGIYVNGPGGSFQSVRIGDWIKKKGDPDRCYRRVQQFFTGANGGGSPCLGPVAQSAQLDNLYTGVTDYQRGQYTRGFYLASDVQVYARSSSALDGLGSNMAWLALRSDTIIGVGGIVTTSLTVDFSEPDGSKVKCTATSHGLIDGDRVTVSAGSAYVGTYVVETEDANTFYIQAANLGSEIGKSAFYATVTTTTRNEGVIQIESANHGFEDNNKVTLAGTTSYDGSYEVKVHSTTSFNIPVGSGLPSSTNGTATLVRLNVRSEFGIVKIVQGETASIGDLDTVNIRSFIGMGSLAETHPTYHVSPPYNTLDGRHNYNSLDNDSLTVRASKLTAMMADRAQDKTVQFNPHGYTIIQNATNGANQDISFPGVTPSLTISMPSSANNGTIGLGGTLSLAANQAAYFSVDRNAAFSLANLSGLTIASISQVPLDESVFIFALRLSSASVWLWDGVELINDINNITLGGISQILNDNAYDELIDVVSGAPASDNQITGPVVASTIITLPTDSRDGDSSQGYIVGNGVLEIYINGVMGMMGVDWAEVGGLGTASTQFRILVDLPVGDELHTRIDTYGGYVGIGGGGGGSVDTASNVGGQSEVFKQKVATDLEFRTLKPGAGISLTQNANDITIAATGAGSLAVATKAVDYSVGLSDDVLLANATVGGITFSLPTAAAAASKVYEFKKIDATGNFMKILPNGVETIDGDPFQSTVVQYESFTMISDGSTWWIL
jgi:hypothetical protein